VEIRLVQHCAAISTMAGLLLSLEANAHMNGMQLVVLA